MSEAEAKPPVTPEFPPEFTISARDPFGPMVVRVWCESALLWNKIMSLFGGLPDEKWRVPAEKLRGAREIALAMERWQEEHGIKVPD